MTQQINDLATRLQAASDAYYNDPTNLLMSDAAFDLLRDQLAALDPTHPFLKQVGAPVSPVGGWQKTKHVIPMSSLNKVQSEAEFRAWGPSRHAMCVTEKLDGISCFDGDTPVHLPNGETIPIREIVEEGLRPQVLTWHPEEGIVARQVTAGFDNGLRDNWIELAFEDGSTLKVTAEHLFYVPDEGWVKACNLLGKDVQDCRV